MSKKIIIIGAGIAGLSAGCYARMNGYETIIVEQHNIPGGLCTGWKRKDYMIDGCIHWLSGCKEKSSFWNYWRELGALQGTDLIFHDEFTRIETGPFGAKKNFIVYSDAEKLRTHMKELGSEDSELIDSFVDSIIRLSTVDMTFDKPFELMKPKDFLNMMKRMKPIWKDYKVLKKMTLEEYSEKFTNPYLKQGIKQILDIQGFSAFALIFMLSCQHSRSAGFPQGGSLPFSERIERRYKELGGHILYSCRVNSIIVEKNRAAGIICADGVKYNADIVISAADGYNTIFKMLQGKYLNRIIKRRYKTMPLFKPFFYLALGVNRDFSGEPHIAVRLTEKPYILEDRSFNRIGIKHYCFDKTMAPPGKSLLEIVYSSDYGWWLRLKNDSEKYIEAKQKIADELIEQLEKLYPGIKEDIELINTATPLTFERYTGNREGTYEGWLLTPEVMGMRMKKTLPGLKNLYMTGQWVQPGGGISSVAKGSRDLIQIICSNDRKDFRTQYQQNGN